MPVGIECRALPRGHDCRNQRCPGRKAIFSLDISEAGRQLYERMSDPANDLSVSFCITCMGRLHHLRQTLLQNIHDNNDYGDIEFLILDYSSADGLREWLLDTVPDCLESKLVTYHRAEGIQRWCAAHAKNSAKKLARGRIVCNLDADNFTGIRFASFLASALGGTQQAFASPSKKGGGTDGRLAFRKSEFEMLGGYDERFTFGYGWEDVDLKDRAVAFGFRHVPIPIDYLRAISHSRNDRVAFCANKRKEETARVHRALSQQSIRSGHLVANVGRNWGSFDPPQGQRPRPGGQAEGADPDFSRDEKASVLFLNWKRIDQLQRILEAEADFPAIGEIIVFNNNKEVLFTYDHPKVRCLNSSFDFGLRTRWILGALATYNCLVFQDDDILLGAEVIEAFLNELSADPRRAYSLHGRNPDSENRYNTIDVSGEAEIILTRATCVHKRAIPMILHLEDQFFKDAPSFPDASTFPAEDIFLSYALTHAFGTKHKVLALPHRNLRSPHAISAQRNYITTRTRLMRQCQAFFSLAGQRRSVTPGSSSAGRFIGHLIERSRKLFLPIDRSATALKSWSGWGNFSLNKLFPVNQPLFHVAII